MHKIEENIAGFVFYAQLGRAYAEWLQLSYDAWIIAEEPEPEVGRWTDAEVADWNHRYGEANKKAAVAKSALKELETLVMTQYAY
jgi:hypothetical protein